MTAGDLSQPRTLAELVAALAGAGEATRIAAGCTDLTLRMRAGGVAPDRLVDVTRIALLRGIEVDAQRVRIGAATTFAEIAADPRLVAMAPCLAQAAAQVGSQQIRNVATLGGNLANASPCADSLPALLVLGAEAGVIDPAGVQTRRPVSALVRAQGGSALQSGEVITDLSFAPLAAGGRASFAKVGVRSSVAVARLNAALLIACDEAGPTIRSARIAFGSVAPGAFLSDALAAMLLGRTLQAATRDALAEASAELIAAAIPSRQSMPYKRHAVRGLIHDLWAALRCAP